MNDPSRTGNDSVFEGQNDPSNGDPAPNGPSKDDQQPTNPSGEPLTPQPPTSEPNPYPVVDPPIDPGVEPTPIEDPQTPYPDNSPRWGE
jgi:hypothetical protein